MLEGTVVNGVIVLDGETQLAEGARVRIAVAGATNGAGAPLERRFRDLVRLWKDATLYLSSITEMATHPTYQQIIGMGREVLPFLLEELRREPDQWFWALKAITGEDRVRPADRGKLPEMTRAWLGWARAHGY
jgi:hypothetical protein